MSTPALKHLLGAYLHPDWQMDYADSLAAVTDFARSEPGSAPKLRAEITALLSQVTIESELQEYLLTELSSTYLPVGDGWSGPREWLLAAADRVDEVLRKSPAA
jgi:hypothetical protein